MCEANVYFLDDDGKEQLVMESVDKIIPFENGVKLESIYSEKKEMRAVIKEMFLLDHKIILEKMEA